MLPDSKFQQLDAEAIVKRVASKMGVILDAKIRALQVSIIANTILDNCLLMRNSNWLTTSRTDHVHCLARVVLP